MPFQPYLLSSVYYLYAGNSIAGGEKMNFPGEHTEAKQTADDDCDCSDCRCGSGWRPSLTDVLLWHAQRAKMELLQEKIKRALEAKRGKVYDKIADALADHLVAQAERATDERGTYDELDERIRGILGKGAKK
jgi:hypothetical protein